MGDDEQKELAVKFHEKIISQQDVFSEIHLSTSPYVAFVKFKHIPSDLNCDISFRSGMSTTNSKLVKCVQLVNSIFRGKRNSIIRNIICVSFQNLFTNRSESKVCNMWSKILDGKD